MEKQLIIERDPAVDDNIVVLDRHDTIAGYGANYGDRLAEWYEDHKLIVIPYWPIQADLEFLQKIILPDDMAKIGSAHRVDQPLFKRKGNSLVSLNPLADLNTELPIKVYLRDQISSVFRQLRSHLPQLFPHYRMKEANITLRFTPTASNGALHLDVFKATSNMHRLKLFINMDTDYRVWRTSYDLLRVMELYKDRFADVSPEIDRNTLNTLIKDRIGPTAPRHVVRYPALSCVIGNGETLLHEVVSGSRMIAMEYTVQIDSMLDPEKYIGAVLPQHMRNLGYSPQTAVMQTA